MKKIIALSSAKTIDEAFVNQKIVPIFTGDITQIRVDSRGIELQLTEPDWLAADTLEQLAKAISIPLKNVQVAAIRKDSFLIQVALPKSIKVTIPNGYVPEED